MDLKKAKELVIKAGEEITRSGLIARTWGNISCRVDEESFVITASGRNYMTLTEDEVILLGMKDMTHRGPVKPSSEKKLHREIYKLKPEANFIIHTHQDNASAISAMGFGSVSFDKEYDRIGKGIICAPYALPGTNRLSRNTARATKESSGNAVIMSHHGAVCWGSTYEEAFAAAYGLEGAAGEYLARMGVPPMDPLSKYVSYKKLYLKAYLDDYAQIAGPKMEILLDGRGRLILSNTEDREAAEMIIQKNCKAFFAAFLSPKGKPISTIDSNFLRQKYLRQYSKLSKKDIGTGRHKK